MSENPTGVTGERGGNQIVPEPETAEPNVVTAPELRSGGLLGRLGRREPKPLVLVEPGTSTSQTSSTEPGAGKSYYISPGFNPDSGNYTITTEGIYNVFTDRTGQVVAKIPQASGGDFFGRKKEPVDKPKKAPPGQTGETSKDSSVTEPADVAQSVSIPIEPARQEKLPPQPTESPVSGMTAEEVQLFEANGITLEQIIAAQAEVSPEQFRQQVDNKLKEFRSQQQQPTLTPEQITQKQAEQQTARIKELEDERVSLKNMPENTDDERRLKLFSQMRVDEELKSLSGEGAGKEGEGSEKRGGSEGPPDLPDRSLEYEASPERGRQIIKEIVRLEGMRAAGEKLSDQDWKELNNLYLQHEIHIEAVRIISLRVNSSQSEESPEIIQEDSLVNLENLKDDNTKEDVTPLGELLEANRTGRITDRGKFLREIDVYFKEAQRVGLLKDLDRVLTTAWSEVKVGIGRKQTSVQIMPTVNQEIQMALDSVREAYNDREWTDPEINRLTGIWDLYAQFARGRFAVAIKNRDLEGITQRPYSTDKEGRIHEYQLGQEKDGKAPKETFWRLQHGWYIEVYAQTEEEFMTAADSYISRLESITADAKKITQEATQFIDVLAKSEGAKKLLETNPKFINELIWGIEARVGVFGADDANDRYNGADYKAFLDFINKDGKGPDRWLTLPKMLEGRVAAALWKFDKDPRWEILFALYGSRGQLAKMSIAQRDRATGQGLYNQVYNQFVEEMLGVRIRNKNDVGKLTQFMPDRKFVSFFNGLYRYDSNRSDYGDANIRAWNEVKGKPDDQLTPTQRQSDRNGVIRLGRIQQELKDGKKLNGSDQRFYDQELAEAKKAVDIAFQMYGALGEKSKRAGGVFKTAEKTDREGKKYRYFVPVHYAEKFIQFAETMTKIKYADVSAKERTAKVKQARDKNIVIFQKDGYEAKTVDADGNPMMLKRPKEDPNAPDELARDARGNVVVEEVPVDFYTATHHAYANWSGHTYWSYQEEHRHLLLSPTMFVQARQIRDGQLRPEDADPVAVQLLVLDPTLRRVRRFEKGFEDRERKLTMAAVEDSYQSHWRIGRELYRAFWPKYGTPAEEIGIYYGLQDYGGFRKTIESLRARIAEDPERFSRRGRRLLPDLHNPVASLSEYLGQGSNGALGSIRMMGYPMYRLAGTFALDKFHANAEVGGKIYDALIGTQDENRVIVEGLLLKLTNDADALLQEFGVDKLPKPGENWVTPGAQQEFCSAVRKSFGRLERYVKYLTTMESLVRNATGALWLENVDILADNGDLNSKIDDVFKPSPAISYVSSTAGHDLTRDDLTKLVTEASKLAAETEGQINSKFNVEAIDEGSTSTNTGSGRHSARIFFDTFINLMLDETKRGGAQLYTGEKYIYAHLKDKIVVYDPNGKYGVRATDDTIADWLFGKFVPN